MSKFLLSCVRFRKIPVESFDGSHANLTEVPPEIYQYRKSLRKLSLNSNRINEISKEVYLLHELRELDLSENDILFVSPNISHITHLTTLNLSKNSLSVLPDSIQQCHLLAFLDLSANPLQTMCAGVTRLPRLKTLLMNGCEMEQLLPSIGNLSQLEVLELRENFLTELPPSAGCLTQLQRLDLGCNEFTELPPCIGCLVSLTELWLDGNMLGILPEEMGSLHKLTFLELTGNQLLSLPEAMGGMSRLTDLYIHDNLLAILPASIEQMTQLSVLRLDLNRLTALPDAIRGWTNLVELSMTHNYVAALPASLGALKKLSTLIVDENLLTTLPDEIGQCTSLRVLSLRDNQVTSLPTSIGQLSQLSVMNIVGNRLVHMPYSMTNLKNLSALWIAENQNRPIVEMQLEHGSAQQDCKWLTCVLFPQQGQEAPYGEQTSLAEPTEVVPKSSNVQKVEVMGPKHLPGKVGFDPAVQEHKGICKLNRDPTPFPKELHTKAMQWRATRELSGEGELEEGAGVQMRHPPRKLQRPYSLLKALQDPIGDILPDDDMTYAFNNASRSNSRSGSSDSSPMTTPLTNRLHDSSEPPDTVETYPNVMETRSPAPLNQTRISSLSPPPLSPPNTEHVEQKGSEVNIATSLSGHLELPNGIESVVTLNGGIQRVTSGSVLQEVGMTKGSQRVNVSEGSQRVNVSEGSQRINVLDNLAANDAINGKIAVNGTPIKATRTGSGGSVLVMESVVETLQEASVVNTKTHRQPNALLILSAANSNSNNNNNTDQPLLQEEKLHCVRLQPVAVGDDTDSAWVPTQKPLPPHPPHHLSNPTLVDHAHTDVEGMSPWYMTSPSSSPSLSPLATSPSRESPSSHDRRICTDAYDHLPHFPKGCTNKKIRSSSCLSWDETTPTHTRGNQRHLEYSRSFDDVIDHMEEGNPLTPLGMALHARQGLEWFKGNQTPGGLEPREHRTPRGLEPRKHNTPGGLEHMGNSQVPSWGSPHSGQSPEPPRSRGSPHSGHSPKPPRSRGSPYSGQSPEPSRSRGSPHSGQSPEPPRSRARNGVLLFPPPHDPIGQPSCQTTPPGPLTRHLSWCQMGQDLPSKGSNTMTTRAKRHSEGSQPGMETGGDLTSRSGVETDIDLASFLSLELTRLDVWAGGKTGDGFSECSHGDGFSECSHATSAVARAKASSISLDHGHVFEVWLSKEPNGVGFSITSGRETTDSSKPGDKGYTYHVWKVAKGSSAHWKGRVRTGDRLVQINGTDVSSLCYAEVMHLFAGPERMVSVVLYRGPSITLL